MLFMRIYNMRMREEDRNIRVNVTQDELTLLMKDENDPKYKDAILKLFCEAFDLSINSKQFVRKEESMHHNTLIYKFDHNGMKIELAVTSPKNFIDEGMEIIKQ